MRRMMMILAMVMMTVIPAAAMTYTQARQEALFLTDKMGYELRLTDAQYDAVYEINLDYLLSVSNRNNLYGTYWTRRNNDLRYVLTTSQYRLFRAANYFYRPVYWSNHRMVFRVYSRYSDRARFYRAQPSGYATYRGGHNVGRTSFYANRSFGQPAVKKAPAGRTFSHGTRRPQQGVAPRQGTHPSRNFGSQPSAVQLRTGTAPQPTAPGGKAPSTGTQKETGKKAQPQRTFGAQR